MVRLLSRFVNRENELQALENWWKENRSQLVIIYGKRRVGKTQLCLQFLKEKPAIYFLADKLPLKLQLKKLSSQVGEYFGDEVLKSRGIEDWEQLFNYLSKKKQKLILIIDEFPYLIEADKAIPSIFQKGWDLYLSNSLIYLILCGSSVSMMLNHTLSPKAPLYGRRSGQILLKPFGFSLLKEMFPRSAFEKRSEIFSIVGGTPAYLKIFQDSRKIVSILKKTAFNKEHFLSQEVEFLLHEEMRAPREYFALLSAIAQKRTRLSEIINQTGFDKSKASSYLNILQDLDIVKREVPITEKYPSRSKKGSYQIKDYFFQFWFKFIFPNKSELEKGNFQYLIKEYQKNKNSTLAFVYQEIASDILSQSISEKRLPFSFTKFGRWWSKDKEIDLIGLNEGEKSILFAEVKWSKRPIGINVYQKLIDKSQEVEWRKKERKEYFALFSKSGFTPKLLKLAKEKEVILFHGENLIPENPFLIFPRD